MKKTIKTMILIMGIALSSFTLTAQNDAIFSGVENTKMYDAVDLINMDRELSTFANLVRLSGLDASAEMAKGYTVFAPTNQAFYEMSIQDFAYLTNPKNKTALVNFVKNHFLSEKAMSYEFNDDSAVSVSGNENIPVSVDENYNRIYIGGARVIKADVQAENSVVHIVNDVINPVDRNTGDSK